LRSLRYSKGLGGEADVFFPSCRRLPSVSTLGETRGR
jgi:hypothetical protein